LIFAGISSLAVVVPSPLVGEGQGGGFNGVGDCSHNAFKVFENVIIRETQHTIALVLEPFVTHLIALDTLLEIVSGAVELNDQFDRMRTKIRNVRTEGRLPSKLN
jgi:hypothetical protein